MTRKKSIIYKKMAVVFSLCAIILSIVLGAGTSLAWFADTAEDVTNIFHFANFDVDVSFLDKNGNWEKIDSRTDIFDQQAKYEPGYVEVVYLRIDNVGDREFEFQTSISVVDSIPSENVYGEKVYLHNYLKIGTVFENDLATLKENLESRDQAVNIATEDPGNNITEKRELASGESCFMAIIVRMPESVGNDANYIDSSIAEVKLGIIVDATQKRN